MRVEYKSYCQKKIQVCQTTIVFFEERRREGTLFAALQIYLKSLNRLLLKFESFAAEGLAPLFASFTRPALVD